MTTPLETKLRTALEARAATINEADLGPLVLDAVDVAPVVPERRRRPAKAAGVLAVAAVVASLLAAIALAGTGPRREPPPATEPDAVQPTAAAPSRVWPLTDDRALPDPERAAQAYLHEVVQLPTDWSTGAVETTGHDAATVKYVLQDVGSTVTLVRDAATGLWFVTGASTERFTLGAVVETDEGGLAVALGSAPRTHEGGVDVRVEALAADGRSLATAIVRVMPAGDGPVARLRWAGNEMAAAVRADVRDDHDIDPDTPEVIIGHASVGIAPPAPLALPPAADLDRAVFAATGAAPDVARAYLADRLPDVATRLDITVRTRGGAAFAHWSHPRSGDVRLSGDVFLRTTPDGWEVVAATTGAVDLSAVRVEGGRVQGQVTSADINSLTAEVHDGTSQIGATAGPTRDDGALDLDIDLADASQPVLRVHHVGGALLSISEVALRSDP